MRDAPSVLSALERTGDAPVALATVLRTRGPAYRRAGAMALFAADGHVLAGGVSAGCLEDDVAARVASTIADGRPRRLRYDADDNPFAIPSGCGGQVEILLEPVLDAESRAGLCGWLRAITLVGDAGAGGIVLSGRADAHGGFTRILATSDGDWWFNPVGAEPLSRATRAALRADAPRAGAGRIGGVYTYEAVDVAWLPVTPTPLLAIGGAMPDAAPIARHVLDLGWRVVVVEHREARRERFGVSGVEWNPGDPASLHELVRDDRWAAALVMYHAEAADREALTALVTAPPAFVGVLGPRSRTARLLAETPLADATAWPDWLHAPVGLDLGADDASEIAVSVVAELLGWYRGATGAPLARREGPLHRASAHAELLGTPADWSTA
ncbi:MAG: XdhC family protein [Gemmatimonadaceae bacterium]|nr:XdhC family protein [Gemmatimonadaceae bacterium]